MKYAFACVLVAIVCITVASRGNTITAVATATVTPAFAETLSTSTPTNTKSEKIQSSPTPAVNSPAPTTPTPPPAPTPSSDYPVRIVIPSINLDDPIEPLGVNSKGEMDVPDGRTSYVGWYKDGTVPGQIGSAVMDAHVFAAFKNLVNVKLGSDIYVVMESGTRFHFTLNDSRFYTLSEIPLQYIFNRADAAHLVLITCAGTYVPSMNTYDHRLVDYATLVN